MLFGCARVQTPPAAPGTASSRPAQKRSERRQSLASPNSASSATSPCSARCGCMRPKSSCPRPRPQEKCRVLRTFRHRRTALQHIEAVAGLAPIKKQPRARVRIAIGVTAAQIAQRAERTAHTPTTPAPRVAACAPRADPPRRRAKFSEPMRGTRPEAPGSDAHPTTRGTMTCPTKDRPHRPQNPYPAPAMCTRTKCTVEAWEAIPSKRSALSEPTSRVRRAVDARVAEQRHQKAEVRLQR
mmetsp:Transcript_119421/g.380896  ORF Transcript_119421/g.380896 Transcript_119421/m.380896 type:complete len:241 (-) Transcript_119421:1259-1981(-)